MIAFYENTSLTSNYL